MKHFGRKLKIFSFVLLVTGVTVSVIIGLFRIVFARSASLSAYIYTLIAVGASILLFFFYYGMGEIISELSAIAENTSATRRAAYHIRRHLDSPDQDDEGQQKE